jgi:flagellar motility protein MotE (MotC chaperone)
MTKQYRLLTRAQLHGAIRDPGYIFTLAEGELGPHRTVVASNHGAQITEHMNTQQELVDQPLYEEVKEPEEVRDEKPATLSPEQEQDKASIAALEAQLADKDKQLGEAHAKLAAVGAAL